MKRCNVCFFNKKYVSLQKQQHYFFSMASNSLWQDDYDAAVSAEACRDKTHVQQTDGGAVYGASSCASVYV